MRKTLTILIHLFILLLNVIPAFSAPQINIEKTESLLIASESIGKRLNSYFLIDQDGRRFGLDEYIGRPFIINFIYTNCTHTCGISTSILAAFEEEISKKFGKKIDIITVSFDYENDTPQKMKEYGEGFTYDFKNWRFATADKATILRLTDELGFYFQKTKNGFDHTNMISVIDSNNKLYEHIYYGEGHFNNDNIKEQLISAVKKASSSTKAPGDLLEFSNVIERLRLICSDYDPESGTYKFSYYNLGKYILGIIVFFIVPIVFIWWKELSSFFIRLKVFSTNVLSHK